MRHRGVGRLLLASLLSLGCDPGWPYGVPGAKAVHADGLRYDLAGPPGTDLRVYGNMFAGLLSISIEFTATGTDSIVLTPTTIAAVNAWGGSLAVAIPARTSCNGERIAEATLLREGTRCTVGVDYNSGVNPWALRTIALTYRGLTRNDTITVTSVTLKRLSDSELSRIPVLTDSTF